MNMSLKGSSAAVNYVDGDGRDDILLGVYLNDDGGDGAGKAYLFLGASLGGDTTIDLADADYSFVGEAEGDYAGISVSSAGDVDGDGLDDILIGAFINDDGGKDSGKAYLILSASLGDEATTDLAYADYSLIGENAGDRAGSGVANAGDVNGDGRSDILVGAYLNSEVGLYTGKAYLILSNL